MKILVVDDSKMIHKMIFGILNELGYTDIIACSNVQEAKIACENSSFGLILSDMHMPGESGLDFLKWIRARPESAKTPFIMNTTDSEKKTIFESVKAGAQTYLLKPIEKHHIAQKLEVLSKEYGFPPPQIAGSKMAELPHAFTATPKSDEKEAFSEIGIRINPHLYLVFPDNCTDKEKFCTMLKEHFPNSPALLITDYNVDTSYKTTIDQWKEHAKQPTPKA